MALTNPIRKTVRFLSYNSTGLGAVKTQWIRNLMDTVDAQFCGLQEHFKKVKALSRHFRAEFPKFENFSIPAHREEDRDNREIKRWSLSTDEEGLGVEEATCCNWRVEDSSPDTPF